MLSYTYGAIEAVTAQTTGLKAIDKALSLTDLVNELRPGFQADKYLLQHAAPFAWTKETTMATLAASRSIPHDTAFNIWNLPYVAAWWHFEEPLPFQTTSDTKGVRALLFGAVSVDQVPSQTRYMVSAFVDTPSGQQAVFENLLPSQTFTWFQDRTLQEMLDDSLYRHRELYGPGGKWHYRAQQGTIIGEEMFMEATEGIAKFILAGLAWITSRVVATDVTHVERHRRKEYEKKVGRPCDVKLVQLRRADRTEHEPSEVDGEETKRAYTCQWQVDGHFRNQRVGPGRAQTKLTWVSPHIKGPEDQPLRVPKHKVYVVSR